MSYIRCDGYRLKDHEDDAAYQVMVGDLKRLQLNLYRGTPNAAYVTPEDDLSGYLQSANNLSDVADAATARTNLGITSATMRNVYVTLSGNYTFVSNTDYITFDSAVDNYGSAYNTTTGVFTAPVTGVYNIGIGWVVRATPTAGTGSAVTYYALYKNATPISYPYYLFPTTALVASAYWLNLSTSVAISLTAGDAVTVDDATGFVKSTYAELIAAQSYFSASWMA